MFDLFSWSHILILLAVALVVVGPKDLPRMMHTAGRWAGKARGMANEFKRSFEDMARQTELDELRKEIESLRDEQNLTDMKVDVSQDPAAEAEQPLPVAAAAPEVDEMPRAGEYRVTETPVLEAEPPAPTAAEPQAAAGPPAV